MSDHPENGGGFQAAPNERQQTGSTAVETVGRIPGDLEALLETSHRSTAGLTGLRCGTALGTLHRRLWTVLAAVRRTPIGLVAVIRMPGAPAMVSREDPPPGGRHALMRVVVLPWIGPVPGGVPTRLVPAPTSLRGVPRQERKASVLTGSLFGLLVTALGTAALSGRTG
ncbi:hypothetical protein ABZW30_11940 [Kitasatospora sp. NPDC004669]|uniref:hypothetical protein n=1 Tax=Kitasatospora sp. NPDC004669 TaxID=3154555 RepID=UPI0033B5029E